MCSCSLIKLPIILPPFSWFHKFRLLYRIMPCCEFSANHIANYDLTWQRGCIDCK